MASNRILRGAETFLASGGTEAFHQSWSPTSTHLFAQSPDHSLLFALANDCAWSTIRGRNWHTFFEVLSCIGLRFPFLAVTGRTTSSNMWSATHLVLKRAQASVWMNRKAPFHQLPPQRTARSRPYQPLPRTFTVTHWFRALNKTPPASPSHFLTLPTNLTYHRDVAHIRRTFVR